MANNYSQFSEMIEDLTPAACEWVETVLGTDLLDAADHDKAINVLADALGQEPTDEFVQEMDNWPHFCWKVEGGGGTSPNVRHDLWLYCEEGYSGTQLAWFVQALIREFLPDYVFTMTTGEWCSKPRISEFGGGWMVISKDEVFGGNTWDAAQDAATRIREGAS